MRRLIAVPALAAVLLVAACSSNSGTKRTVTVVNTVTGGSSSSAGPAKTTTGSSIVVGSSASAPTGSGSAGGSSGKSTTSTAATKTGTSASGSVSGTTQTTASTTVTTSSTKSSTPAFKKVDPTAANCADLMDSGDVQNDLGFTIGNTNSRIRLGAGDNGATKAIRCLYGSKDGGKTAPVRIRLTEYDSAAHAEKQLKIDLESGGVKAITVGGFPASLQIANGGLIEMRYDTWTMTLAVSDNLASSDKLTSGLPKLATQVLARVLKS